MLQLTNGLRDDTSIHWHGVLVPFEMDGVPGIGFPGIKPGETFAYHFRTRQSGTYWYHSHSGLQEQTGVCGPMIIDPADPDPYDCDREYVAMLGGLDVREPPQRATSTSRGIRCSMGARPAGAGVARDRLAWARMRMDPTDLADVTGHTYTYLVNGLPPAGNWTGLFRPGERVRLRFINAGAGTYFDVRIPGLEMTVVQADGQNLQPVTVEELRIAGADTREARRLPARAWPDRSPAGGRAPCAPWPTWGWRTTWRGWKPATAGMQGHDMAAMEGHDMESGPKQAPPGAIPAPIPHGPVKHGRGNSMTLMETRSRLSEPGVGLDGDGRRVLLYTDLKGLAPTYDQRAPGREMELHLTGNRERYLWSFDGKAFSQAKEPIRFEHGERLRLTFVNDTMMEHPIHLHGMWMELENGPGGYLPKKHTVNVKPAERLSVLVTADAPGRWALHCHILYHMDMGMFRAVEVTEQPRAEARQ